MNERLYEQRVRGMSMKEEEEEEEKNKKRTKKDPRTPSAAYFSVDILSRKN